MARYGEHNGLTQAHIHKPGVVTPKLDSPGSETGEADEEGGEEDDCAEGFWINGYCASRQGGDEDGDEDEDEDRVEEESGDMPRVDQDPGRGYRGYNSVIPVILKRMLTEKGEAVLRCGLREMVSVINHR